MPVLRALAPSVSSEDTSAPVPSQPSPALSHGTAAPSAAMAYKEVKEMATGIERARHRDRTVSCKQIFPMSQYRLDNSQQRAELLLHMGNPGDGVHWLDKTPVIN